MAIRMDRDKRKDAHAHRMKRNQRIAPRGSKDVLRFAPNFSVYVLPPDTVCLYSEDRKFFLHGELYCALAAALSELVVRVAKRSAAPTIVLVGDYLDARLAELNRKNLSDRTPWVVVQPSGIFPLVGPVLRPGKGACWVCLAARMVRNREI